MKKSQMRTNVMAKASEALMGEKKTSKMFLIDHPARERRSPSAPTRWYASIIRVK